MIFPLFPLCKPVHISSENQNRKPEARWLLKTPHHLEWLDVLLDVFEGARIIWPHRDLVTTMASFCSMVAHERGVFSDDVDPHEVGREGGRKVVRLIGRAMRPASVPPREPSSTFVTRSSSATRWPRWAASTN